MKIYYIDYNILLFLYLLFFINNIVISNSNFNGISISNKNYSIEDIIFYKADKNKASKSLRSNSTSIVLAVKNKKLPKTKPLTKKTTLFSEWDSKTSRIVCQFFVFGTLFGVVCSISACACLLQPKNRHEIPDISIDLPPPTLKDDGKPIRIQFGDDGLCYAHILDDKEIPPLPDYYSALSLPNDIISSLHRQMIILGLLEEESTNKSIINNQHASINI
ncbi:Hypothetical protein SRAE_2000335900 [Strongyloides ratti]|uniref:Uncharacterized protein n=1 Tax=Strongyloides ratti TaxID=34506 RepID=A0A090MZC7_STRRB|nr:Hypothetical protein SRAE_2000335900 [Strongyloides ratti]CEF68704.1 Hypothetical protein SRAE_2000335900 [Strongyloides ratti]